MRSYLTGQELLKIKLAFQDGGHLKKRHEIK